MGASRQRPFPIKAFLHVVFPAAIGVILLILQRTLWLDAGSFQVASNGPVPQGTGEPSLWLTVVFASPMGFLVYAATSLFLRIWPTGSIGIKALWISVAPTVAVGVEVGQAAHWLPGTFSPLDLMSWVVGTCLALITGTWSREQVAIVHEHRIAQDRGSPHHEQAHS